MVSHTKSDPTMAVGVRGRGISSLALGSSYTEGSIWGITADSWWVFRSTIFTSSG